MKWWTRWTIGMLMVVAAGCGTTDRVTEGDRNLSFLNVQAAKRIEKTSAEPETQGLAVEIDKNAGQQLVGWGAPKAPPPVTPDSALSVFQAQGGQARDQSKEEHSGWLWPLLGTLALWGLREVGVMWFPFLGPLLDKFSPKLAGGSTSNENAAVASQEVIQGLKSFVPAEKKEEIKNFMDRVFSRYGVSSHASSLFEKYVRK